MLTWNYPPELRGSLDRVGGGVCSHHLHRGWVSAGLSLAACSTGGICCAVLSSEAQLPGMCSKQGREEIRRSSNPGHSQQDREKHFKSLKMV